MTIDILAFGRATMATSASGIPTPYDQLNQAGTIQSTFASVQYVVTIPTFSGISSLVAQINGALRASWSVATTPLTPIVYDVYIQAATATGLFVDANKVRSTFGLTIDLFSLTDGTLLALGTTYFVGIRARDPYGNVSTTTASLSAVSLGVQPSRVLAPGDIPSIVLAVWSELQAGYATPGTFGKYLDAQLSLKASQVSVDTINTKVGTPVTSVSADIAAVKAVDDTINTKVGTPVASVSADIAAVKAVDDTINTKLGNPVGSTFSADIQSVQTSSNLSNTKLGTPAGASVSADVASVKADAVTLLSRLTPGRAGNLDNLDVAVSSRESEGAADSRNIAELSAIADVLTAVQGIQNNTNFVAVVPAILAVPPSGTTPYKFFASLFDTAGTPEDPDSNTLNYKIEDTSGATVVATTAMTRDAVGRFSATYNVAAGAADADLVFIFTYAENSVSFTHHRTTRVQSESSDLDTLLSRLTPTRAANLDNLDVVVSSRLANADDLTRVSNLLSEHATTQAAVAAVSGKIGTPVLGSVTADVTAVRIQTDKIGSPANVTLAADLVAIKAATDARESEASALTRYNTLEANDIAILAAVSSVQNNTTFAGIVPPVLDIPQTGTRTYRFFANLFNSTNTPVDPDSNLITYRIETAGGAPVVPTTPMTRDALGQYHTDYVVASADTAQALNVFFDYELSGDAFSYIRATTATKNQANLDILVDRLTEQRADNLDFLDVAVSTRTVQTDVDTLLSRLTAPRAANLDNLDALVSLVALETTAQAIKAHTDDLPTDFDDIARTFYINRMTTVLNNLTGIQEVLVWPEKNGQVTSGTNCTITVKDDLGTTIWTGFSAAPGSSGVFLFSHSFAPMADGNYYVETSIVVDGTPRINRQPFVAVG